MSRPTAAATDTGYLFDMYVYMTRLVIRFDQDLSTRGETNDVFDVIAFDRSIQISVVQYGLRK